MDKITPIVGKLPWADRQVLAAVIGEALASWERAMSLDSIDELRRQSDIGRLKLFYAVLNDPMIGVGVPAELESRRPAVRGQST